MTAHPPKPGGEVPQPAAKRRRFPWASLFAIAGLAVVAAAVLIPSYGNYADRAQVAEAFTVLVGARAPLAEYYEKHRRWPVSLGEVQVHATGARVQTVAITRGAGGQGEIELTATLKTEGVDRRVAGKSVGLESADGRSWRCVAGTVPEKTLPLSCREPR
jgi:type IV pilus assembly protein PilA